MPLSALVIDDDSDVQLLGKMLLCKRGYEVVTAGSLGELARRPALLDAELILLDFGLGEFTGLDILDYLYDLRLNAAILLLSSCSEETASHAIAAGRARGLKMLGFLPKAKLLTGLSPFLEQLQALPKPPTRDELANAIQAGHLYLVFQPKKNLQTGHIIGVEALVRWEDPQRGMLYPDTFIPLAEKSGLMGPLTWCILKLAFAQQERWQARGWDLQIAVNVPAAFLQSEHMLEKFDELTKHRTASLHYLTLELTESVGVECLGYARHILEALRQRGCRLALDDFGTGYSSLIQLYRLPFNELKVDRSFVSLIDHDSRALAITLSVVDLGKQLGMTVVAEGIENEAQQALLIDAGCPVGQGYFISRPLTAQAFNDWMAKTLTKLTHN
ncbi:EAL domain-containing protein [Halomonas qaidamensis]|uniref:EAL domain-containing protein n=1 Tax=Halomonas qaidamensis TaxID=2866211 RepID=A0ABY6JS75_9GAMM|nr:MULTISPECIES: EAL domain-containing protein [Halomonas]UYV19871.1 EAL domain-containing protein [Halomonas qaidamensis]